MTGTPSPATAADPPPRYRVYLSDVSYFSGKLEGALRAKRIAYERVTITPAILLGEVLPATGWMKVPAMRRDDGTWLCDTTPLLRWLDAEHPQRRLLADDPCTAFLSTLVEDYCDEWHWRPAMFWRWHWADNARWLGTRLGHELARDSLHPAWAMGLYFRKRQQRIFLRGDGVTRANAGQVADLYPRALAWLEQLLANRRYLLGARPSLVDIAWFGPMFRHYAQDPRPAAVMAATAPRTFAWAARLWNAGAEEWNDAPLDGFADPAWDAVFADLGGAYLPYLRDNAAAVAAGVARFDGNWGGIAYPRVPAVPYRARCLNTLSRDYAALAPAVRAQVDARLAGSGIVEQLRQPSPAPALAPVDSALCGPPRELGLRERLGYYFSGTPWRGKD